MTRKGQIGADLKGVNNQILEEIEKDMIDTIQKEVKLLQSEREYSNHKLTLRNSIASYKKNIMQEIENLKFI
jgi:hypothetical protein